MINWYPRSYINYLNKNLKKLNKYEQNADSFIKRRIIFELIVIIVLLLFRVSVINIVLITIFIHGYYNFICLNRHLIKIDKSIAKDSLMYFETLLLLIDSGKNLDDSLLLASSIIPGYLSDQIKYSLLEIKMRKDKKLVYNELYELLDKSIVSNILFALKDENIPVLVQEVESLRINLVNKHTRMLNNIPSKLLTIFIFVLIPLILLLIYSVNFIKYI